MSMEKTETITREDLKEKIYKNIFSTYKCYIKQNKANIKISYISYSDAKLSFRIPDVKQKDIAEVSIIFVRDDQENIYFLKAKLQEKQEKDVFVFSPLELVKKTIPRKEERINLNSLGDDKKLAFVCNFMTDFLIQEHLHLNKKKLDQLKSVIKVKLEKNFDRIIVHFINEGSSSRMKYFKKNICPLQITSIKECNPGDSEEAYDYYLNNIYNTDPFLTKNTEYTSEISVPILYKMRIPYGFVQVNNITPLDSKALSIVKKMAVITEELLQKNKVFPAFEDRLPVLDLSKTGIGIFFREIKYIKYFKEDAFIYFDLMLPGNIKVNIAAVIKHISKIENKFFKVGCEFQELDALSEVNYMEFLESLGLKTK